MDGFIKLDLYHGTSRINAKSILANGIDFTKRRPRSNNCYGDGFYMTSKRILAENHINEQFDENDGIILEVKILIEPRYVKKFNLDECWNSGFQRQFVDLALKENCSLLDLSADDGMYIICSNQNIDIEFWL